MKILALIGTPRKGSNTDLLVDKNLTSFSSPTVSIASPVYSEQWKSYIDYKRKPGIPVEFLA